MSIYNVKFPAGEHIITFNRKQLVEVIPNFGFTPKETRLFPANLYAITITTKTNDQIQIHFHCSATEEQLEVLAPHLLPKASPTVTDENESE